MRCFLVTLLMLVVFPVWADWAFVAASEYVGRFYIDPHTIQKNGDIRRAQQLNSWNEPLSDGSHSMRYLMEYDCNELQDRSLEASVHSGPMGNGLLIRSFPFDAKSKFSRVKPGSVGLTILNYVCTR